MDKEELWSRWWRAFPVQPSGWAVHEWSAETLGFETRAERDLMLVLHRPVEPTAPKRTFRASHLPLLGW